MELIIFLSILNYVIIMCIRLKGLFKRGAIMITRIDKACAKAILSLRNMRTIFHIVMSLAVTLSFAVTSVAATAAAAAATASEEPEHVTRVHAVEEIVKVLYTACADGASGIGGIAGAGGFVFEDCYCLHPAGGGYVHFACDVETNRVGYPIYCEIYRSVDGCGFSDISDENENCSIYLTLAKAMGIVDGYDDNTFRPDDNITYNEAVKIIVRAFSLSGSAELYAYPDGYIEAACDMGIISSGADLPGDGSASSAGLPGDGSVSSVGLPGDSPISSADFYGMLQKALDKGYARNFLGTLTPYVAKAFIPVQGQKYNPEDFAYHQISQAAVVSIGDAEILSLSELSDDLSVCWYLDGDVQKCAYSRHGGEWICFLAEDSGYREGYGAALYGELFGHNGFSIQAQRGAAYYANDYYYFDKDDELRFLFNGTYLDIPVDTNNDGINELLWFYHGGRDASYFYSVGDDIYMFDIVDALSARYPDFDAISVDPLSLTDNKIRISYHLRDKLDEGANETFLIIGYDEMVFLEAYE